MSKTPFADVRLEENGFSLPELKWRELLFIGAFRWIEEEKGFRRDLARLLPPFERSDLFEKGALFQIVHAQGRVHISSIDAGTKPINLALRE